MDEKENIIEAKYEVIETEETKDTKDKDVFAVDKLQDIISPARKKVISHWSDRNPDHMFEYLASKISMINKHLPNTRKIIDKRMKDEEKTLYTNRGQLDKKEWFEWWELIEGTGEDVDQHGFYKPRGFGQEIIIAETPMIYDYGVIFGLMKLLFEKGRINVYIGSMDSGKSNMALGLGLQSIQLGYYILASNLGIKERYEHQWIKQCSWLYELLRILCFNKIDNIKYVKEGKPLKRMYVNTNLDEGESIMSAKSRSDDKAAGEFLKFTQFARKLDSSISFIYHDMANFPNSMRTSNNINAIIYKGMDKEGKKLNDEQKEAIIDFPARKFSIHLDNIPECELLDTDEWSTFEIVDDNRPDKSITMNEIFSIVKGKRSYEVPHVILRYLDNLSFENQPYESVLEMIKKIHSRIGDSYLPHCEKSKQYETILRREMESTYQIADASKIRFSDKAIRKIAQEEFDLFQVEQSKSEPDPSTIKYKECDFDELIRFITKLKPPRIKDIVGSNYREIDTAEIRELLNRGVSKSKIMSVYSYRVRKIDLFKDFEVKATLLKE